MSDDNKLHIDRGVDLRAWVGETLEKVALADLPEHSTPCPHCGVPIRFPLVAREQDLSEFESLMRSAFRVMDKYGITANLLAEIRAQCVIEIAQRKARKEQGK